VSVFLAIGENTCKNSYIRLYTEKVSFGGLDRLEYIKITEKDTNKTEFSEILFLPKLVKNP